MCGTCIHAQEHCRPITASPPRPDLPENWVATQSEPDSCEDTGNGRENGPEEQGNKSRQREVAKG